MNFAREKCDARALQSLMHDGAFALQACNESFGTAIAVAASDVGADLNSTVAPDCLQNTFGCGRVFIAPSAFEA
jgi:hypothetical protein